MPFRPAQPQDADAISALAVTAGLFPVEEAALVEDLMREYFAGKAASGSHQCVVEAEVGGEESSSPRELLSVAYYHAVPATEGTWNLTMVAVAPAVQRTGRGTALLAHVEAALAGTGQRLLLVETSGSPAYERARAFYERCGFGQEARVRDYYAAGEDMILLRKLVGAATSGARE